MRCSFVILLALLLFPTRIGYAQDTVPVLSPGIHDLTLAQSGAPTIHYAISVPPHYRGEPVPLVLALHFGGDPEGAGRSMLDILIQPALGDLGAVIVAPDSLSGGWSSAQNEQAVNALLAAVEKSYAIDQKKVIVTGYSMGGQGTWYWADKYPERFSAAVPVSGRPTPSATTWRVPVFAVHSRADQVNPIGPTEQRIAELRKKGLNAQLVALAGIAHFETNRFVDGLRQAVPWILQVWKTK
jgi:predicted peptidase